MAKDFLDFVDLEGRRKRPGDCAYFLRDGSGRWVVERYFSAPSVTMRDEHTGQRRQFAVDSAEAERFERASMMVKDEEHA